MSGFGYLPIFAEQNELTELKMRVAQLEEQNRTILRELENLKARLGSSQQLAPHPAAPVRWPELIAPPSRLKFYGLLRLDIDLDSQRPNNTQIPFFITSEDPLIGKRNAGSYSMHPRLTRFGMDLGGSRFPGLNAILFT